MSSDVTELHPRSITTLTAADIRRVAVIGAGQMGSGIAQVCAAADRMVWVCDIDAAMLERSQKTIHASAEKLHSKGVLDDAALTSVKRNLVWSLGTKDAPMLEVDLVIEAAKEDVDVKTSIFEDLDRHTSPHAILATNTSSIPITTIAAATHRPAHVVGLHFMNPVPMLDLVEVISGLETAPFVVSLVEEFARDLGKTPVRSADSPGFITNRILMPMINEAFFCLLEGVGEPEHIDAAMKLGMKHPMGPLSLADLIGLDTCLAIMEVLHKEIGDDKYRPCPLLRSYVAAGRHGRKVGAGVYSYDSEGKVGVAGHVGRVNKSKQ